MLKTISSRAQSTAEKLREMGKAQPELHESLRNPQNSDAKTNMNNMLKLSHYIRELNDLLGVGKKAALIVNEENTKGVVELLPEGHPEIELIDKHDNSNLLSNKKYECPYCRQQFPGKVPISSRLNEAETTLDQRVIYSNFNILLYNNIVCPNCNYCDSYREFARGSEEYYAKFKGNQFGNIENFTGFKDEMAHTFDEAILSYYLQLHCLKQVPKSSLRCAKTYHKLHWLFKDCSQDNLAQEAALKSRAAYQTYIEENISKIALIDLITLNVIIAELSVFMGEIKMAVDIYTENTIICSTLKHDLVDKSFVRAKQLKDML